MRERSAVLLLLVLGGCGHASRAPDPVASGTPTSVISRDRLQPGKWSATPNVTALDLPGAPPEQVERMKAALAPRMSPRTWCLSAEDASKPPIDLVTGDRTGECRTERMTMAAGRLDGAVTCQRASRAQPMLTTAMRLGIVGGFTPTDYSIDATITYSVPGKPDGTASIKLVGHRLGACI